MTLSSVARIEGVQTWWSFDMAFLMFCLTFTWLFSSEISILPCWFAAASCFWYLLVTITMICCSQSLNSISKLSKSEIQNELRKAQRNYLEQVILPKVVETEDFGPVFNQDSVDFSLRIKERLEESRKLQGRLEARIRKSMKRFGEEKRYIVHSPSGEIMRGFPDIKLKWMFGDKEVVLPKAIGLHLYHGWKSWREEVKANLKKNLLEDVEFGREYVAQQQVALISPYRCFSM